LNHPNILTVYEVGRHDDLHFIAAEFIIGETLRQRLKGEPRSLREILDIALQATAALNAAHRSRIVHRDIKPENIMLRDDGFVKVLDFGLAKLVEKSDPSPGAKAVTRAQLQTQPGMIMGTVAYMSPEQARGTETDARSDIWSLGVVLYEMLGGRLPFTGETMMDVISAIMNDDPTPLPSFAAHLPGELVRIVHKTLKKKPEQRYQTSKDLLNDLKDLRDALAQESFLERTAVPNKTESKEAVSSALKLSTSSGGRLKDSLLLTDFENQTGEAIFDHTLKTALTFSLGQSPFLDIVPDAKVALTLRQMKRATGERVTRELAEEICLRLNLKAYLAGSVSNLGAVYFLTLEAVNARTG
jgi:serine/threonine protein kinase